jgi:putative membrane protein
MQDTVGLSYWLTLWNWDVSLIVGFVLVIGGYLYTTGPLRRTRHLGPPVPFSRGLAFLLGADICFLALCSPLDALADTYLFSAHMLQHMLLSFAGAPLMVLGIPGWLLRPLLRYRPVLAIWKILTHPVITSLLFSTNLWLWHAPLLGPAQGGWPPLSLGGKLAYLFFNDMPMVLLGAGLTFMPPLYEPYLHIPRLWGITPALDQQLGGLLTWIVGSIFFIVLASLFFLRWMLQQENADHIPLSTGLEEAEQRGSRKTA